MPHRQSGGCRVDQRSRRQLLATIGVSGAALLAGCSDDSTSSPAGDSTSDPSGEDEETNSDTDTPASVTEGGSLNIGFRIGVEDLNPLVQFGGEGTILGSFMYSKLTYVDHNEEIQPELATDWESNSTDDVWTFTLNEDATFHHNGNQVLAEDVKASLETVNGTNRAPTPAGTLYPMEEIRVVDDTTVEFHLEHPYLDFPHRTAKRWSSIVPKNILDNDWEALSEEDFGSGPFVLEEYSVNEEYTLSANEDYHKTDDEGRALPYLDEVTILVEPDAVTRANSLTDGRTDLLHIVSPSNFQRLEGSSGVDTVQRAGGKMTPLIMPLTLEPFDDLRVRQAVKYAVDKHALLQGAQQGYGEVQQDHPIPSFQDANADLEPKFGYEADVEKAQELLDEGGYGRIDLPPLHFVTDLSSAHKPLAQLIQNQLREINIHFDLRNVTEAEWYSDVFGQKDQWTLSLWSMRILPEILLQDVAHSEANSNNQYFDDDEYDETVDELLRTTDSERKSELMTKAQRIFRDRGGWMVPFTFDRLDAKATSVQNYQPEVTSLKFPGIEGIWVSDEASNT